MTVYAVRPRLRSPIWAAVVAITGIVASAGVSGCGGADSGSDPASRPSTPAGGSGERVLTVFAAASLTKSFEAIGDNFEAQNEGVSVRFNFGGSSGLVAQLEQGARGDVLATANEQTMTKASGADLIAGSPAAFATNTLTIAVPRGNPAKVSGLRDLTKPGVKVVVCAPAVPCGAATKAVETSSGIDLAPASEEQAVTDVLGKVRSGQADAGLVYVTDIQGALGEVEAVADPAFTTAVNVYPIATLADSAHPDLAQRFIETVLSVDGQRVLSTAGFGPANDS